MSETPVYDELAVEYPEVHIAVVIRALWDDEFGR